MPGTGLSSLSALASIILRIISWNEHNYSDPYCTQEESGPHLAKKNSGNGRARIWIWSSQFRMTTTLPGCLPALREKKVSKSTDQMLTIIISHKWKDWCRFFLIAKPSKFSTPTFLFLWSSLLFVIQYTYIILGQKVGLSLTYLKKSSHYKVKRRVLRKSLQNKCFHIYLHLSIPIIAALANLS